MSDNVSNQNQGAIMDDSGYAILWDEWMQDVWAEDDDGAQDRAICLTLRAVDHSTDSSTCTRPSFLGRLTVDGLSTAGTISRPEHMNKADNLDSDHFSGQRGPASGDQIHDTPLVLKDPTSLLCPHNCGRSRPFNGRYELNRHIRTEHGVVALECPFRGCFKGPKRKTFKRSDKLTAHIRAVHHGKQLDCSAKGCAVGSMTLDILAIHLTRYHCRTSWAPGVVNAVINAGSRMYRKCPVWHCHWSSCRSNSRDAYMQHLENHSHDDLLSVQDKLATENYFHFHHESEIDAATSAEFSGTTALTATSRAVRVRCPVCRSALFTSHDDLEYHINITHLVNAEHREHFIAWRAYMFRSEAFADRVSSKRILRPFVDFYVRRVSGVRCPFCPYSPKEAYRKDHHHDTMLADPEKIKPFRAQILKSYPDFADYEAVWDDIRF